MGALSDMRAFYHWLEDATDKELTQRRDILRHAIECKLSEESVIADAKYLLKKIEEEMLARAF